jgi:hypothetical protein
MSKKITYFFNNEMLIKKVLILNLFLLYARVRGSGNFKSYSIGRTRSGRGGDPENQKLGGAVGIR